MKTVKPGDDFYMYALGTWFNSHTEGLEITKQVIIFAEKNKNSGGRYECRAPASGLGRKNLVLIG